MFLIGWKKLLWYLLLYDSLLCIMNLVLLGLDIFKNVMVFKYILYIIFFFYWKIVINEVNLNICIDLK